MKTPQELADDIIAFHERRLTRLKELKQIGSKRKGLDKEIETLEKHIAEISKWKEVT